MMQPARSAADVAAARRNAAAAGVALEIRAADPCEVYPDHWVPMQVAQAMGTQWNVSAAGVPIGWRYEALPLVFQMLEVPRSERPGVFEELQVLESEMKSILRERKS